MPIQIRRTETPNDPPTGLAEGQLSVEMASTPPKLWVGVPTTIDASGRLLLAPSGLRITTQVFTASGTYTPPSGLQYAVVECIGGGGGGGACPSTQVSGGGGGGGSGGYSRRVLSAAQIGASQAITIGGGGAGSAFLTDLTGGAGGATSFGSLCIANGGAGASNFSPTQGMWGAGGEAAALAGAVGDVTLPGPTGEGGFNCGQDASNVWAFRGGRGASVFGGGASASTAAPHTQSFAGNVALANTGGGGGGAANNGGAQVNGGAGGSGICIVTEYGF